MDDSGAVEGHGGHKPAVHQVNQDESKPCFNHVAPQTPDYGPAVVPRLCNGMGQISKVLRAQQAGETLQKLGYRASLDMRPRKLLNHHLTGPVLERIGSDPAEVERLYGIPRHADS